MDESCSPVKPPPLLSHRVAVESSPDLVPVLRELQTDADRVVGHVQLDHELGLEAQRNLAGSRERSSPSRVPERPRRRTRHRCGCPSPGLHAGGVATRTGGGEKVRGRGKGWRRRLWSGATRRERGRLGEVACRDGRGNQEKHRCGVSEKATPPRQDPAALLLPAQ